MNNDIIHKDEYRWGDVYYIISNGGYGVVRVQHDKDNPKEAMIVGLSVHESHRMEGIGTHLIYAAENLIASLPDVDLISILAEKEWIANWYERLGYTPDVYDDEQKFLWLVKNVKDIQ